MARLLALHAAEPTEASARLPVPLSERYIEKPIKFLDVSSIECGKQFSKSTMLSVHVKLNRPGPTFSAKDP